MDNKDDILKAAIHAAQFINAMYVWLEKIDKAGGSGSISGIAECHAMLKSMKANAKRLDTLIMVPLAKAIEDNRNHG